MDSNHVLNPAEQPQSFLSGIVMRISTQKISPLSLA